MKRYQPVTHRTLGVAAAALMTVATLAVAVIVPAGVDQGSEGATSVQTAVMPDDTCVTTRIDVIAVRVPHAQRAASANTQRVNS